MKLIDLIKSFDSVDEELIIFQENLEDFNSDIILRHAEEGDNGIKIDNHKKYYYLIEVFLAKEFVEDWIQSLNYKPTDIEIAKRLFVYGTKDV